MGGKILVALLLLALVFMTFKFMREREARLRERIERGERGRAEEARAGEKETEADTVTLRRDPRTGVYVPEEETKGRERKD